MMSIAKKCDRCGKMYDQYNVKDSEANPNGIRLLNIDGRQQCFSHKLIDLCPDCMKQLQNWLKDSDMIATLPDNDIYDKCKTCQSNAKYQEENKALKDQIKQLAAEKQERESKVTAEKPIDTVTDAAKSVLEHPDVFDLTELLGKVSIIKKENEALQTELLFQKDSMRRLRLEKSALESKNESLMDEMRQLKEKLWKIEGENSPKVGDTATINGTLYEIRKVAVETCCNGTATITTYLDEVGVTHTSKSKEV